jgi:hypothetical protein
MNATATADAMKLSRAQQHAIFSRFSWTTDGRIRVKCTHSTEVLLKLAGVHNPTPFEYYALPAKRDLSGFIVLDREAAHVPPVAESDDSLFEPGGLFVKDAPPVVDRLPALPVALSERSEIAPELAALAELPCTRSFEINAGPQRKFRVLVIAFEDHALPSPNEREQWLPAKPADAEIREACAALLHNRLQPFEKL